MIRTRPTIHVIALLVGMAVLFNVERLDFIEENLIDIRTFVYVIGILAVILIVASAWVLRWPLAMKVAVCLGVYTLVKLYDSRPEPWWGGRYTAITLVEISLLTLLVILAHRLALGLRELEKVYGRTRLADVRKREKSAAAAAEQVQMAMALARRHHLPLSVLAIEIAPSTAVEEDKTLQHGGMNAAHLLEGLIRATDLFLAQPRRGHYVIVCQHTDAAGAEQLAQRTRDVLASRTGRTVLTGIATFPGDAQRFEDLVHDAEERLHPGPSGWCDANRAAYAPNVPLPGPPDTPVELHANLATATAPLPTYPGYTPTPTIARDQSAAASTAPKVDPLELEAPWLARIRPERRLLRGQKYVLAKWCMDLAIVLMTMPLWLPLLALCALAVKLESPRDPVLFRQERTGRGGRRFHILKLRTMSADAEAEARVAVTVPELKLSHDPRVTRVGRVLRRTSLDELPQLLNVLGGQMSLVGPRPTSLQADCYAVWQTERLDVMPGMTGLWQLLGRGVTPWEQRMRFDIAYIEKRCLWLDIQILLRTIPAVLSRRGAY